MVKLFNAVYFGVLANFTSVERWGDIVVVIRFRRVVWARDCWHGKSWCSA